jgi:hypothetical protein
MTKRVIEWKQRHDLALESFGVTAIGGQGITREQYEAEQDALRREIMDNVGWMKPRVISELLRVQG